MMLQAPEESPYDLRFNLFGFYVRVSWSFWLGAIFFGWNLIEGFSGSGSGMSKGAVLIMWVGCMFLSILIHELGHAFAMRFYGIHSSVVLYHFGGLAIPEGGQFRSTFGRKSFQSSEWQQFWISLAGPAAQILSVVVLALAVKATGHAFQGHFFVFGFLREIPWIAEGNPIENPSLRLLIILYTIPSIFWAVLNLVPIYPLDGGQIMKSLVTIFGGQTTTWLTISLITASLGVLYGLANEQWYTGILCASFAFSNYQMLQQYQGRGY